MAQASLGSGTPATPRPRPRLRLGGTTRVVVRDGSMRPTLEPGDRLRVDRRAYRDRPPSVGDLVVLEDPERPSRWLVKRVASVDPDRAAVEVRGDAAEVARDSRRFGPVPFRSLVGRVVARYAPAGRRCTF